MTNDGALDWPVLVRVRKINVSIVVRHRRVFLFPLIPQLH